MDSVSLFCTAALIAGGLYWFAFVLGAPEQKGKRSTTLSSGSISGKNVRDNFEQYTSFFRRENMVESADKVPDVVDTFYDLVTDIFEWGWGQSFHFAPSIPGKSHRDATRLHEEMAADLIQAHAGQRLLDVGCGVGGPMRAIAAHSQAHIVGITINDYQVKRAKLHNKKAGLDSLCEVVCGNFLDMPFSDNSFDGAFAIETTIHAPSLEQVYSEVFRVLKPGALFVSYEWVATKKYNPNDPAHVAMVKDIEVRNALPRLNSYAVISPTARKVGFEVLEERDMALPPAGPWWTRLRVGKIAYWRNHVVVTVLAALGIVPKGTLDVHQMLLKSVDELIRSGDTGVFSPMHMILCRKPLSSS